MADVREDLELFYLDKIYVWVGVQGLYHIVSPATR